MANGLYHDEVETIRMGINDYLGDFIDLLNRSRVADTLENIDGLNDSIGDLINGFLQHQNDVDILLNEHPNDATLLGFNIALRMVGPVMDTLGQGAFSKLFLESSTEMIINVLQFALN